MLTIIKQAHLYTPKDHGLCDLLIASNKILAIDDDITINSNVPVQIIHAEGKKLIPGLVDSLVHITGGGGEGGFHTRTPQMNLTDATLNGITTCVGVLGTDSTTRSLPDLLAKARALTHEGISVYCHTGSYQVPVTTITGSVRDDIILIPEFIGVGEVAIADHRSSCPSMHELRRIASEARVGGMLSGKKGIVSIHMGDSNDFLSLLHEVIQASDIPASQFYPTHINRNKGLLEDAKAWASKGGLLDLTTSTTEMDLANGEPRCSEALAELLDDGVALSQITFSSDGHASLPVFNEQGELTGLKVGSERSLWNEVVLAVEQQGVDFESAIAVVTQNPARVLGLAHKGEVAIGKDADLLLIDDDMQIDTVIAKGQLLVQAGEALVKGTFE